MKLCIDSYVQPGTPVRTNTLVVHTAARHSEMCIAAYLARVLSGSDHSDSGMCVAAYLALARVLSGSDTVACV